MLPYIDEEKNVKNNESGKTMKVASTRVKMVSSSTIVRGVNKGKRISTQTYVGKRTIATQTKI